MDYEERRYSYLWIESSDNGVAGDRTSLNAYMSVYVRVLDVNEPPIPIDARFSVSEDAKVGQSIGRALKAKDPDQGQSDTLSFSIDRENCFSIKTGKKKRYVAFSPKYKNIMDHTITFKASAEHSVHLLMYNSGGNTVEIVYGANQNTISKIQACKKVELIGTDIVPLSCEELVSKASPSILLKNKYTDVWVQFNALEGTISTGTGVKTESPLMSVEGFANITFAKYAVSTGYGTVGAFTNVCLPQETKHDRNVFALRPGKVNAQYVLALKNDVLDYGNEVIVWHKDSYYR